MATELAADYWEHKISISVPGDVTLGQISAPTTVKDTEEATWKAVLNPIGAEPLSELARKAKNGRVAIAFDDPFRPEKPRQAIIKVILEVLNSAGVKDENITLLCAGGMHPKRTPAQLRGYLGSEIFDRFHSKDTASRLLNHDCCDPNGVIYMGISEMGDYVEHNRLLHDSDLFIYQGENDVKEVIDAKFNIFDQMSYGFEIFGDYDKNKDIIIDPLIYSTFIGGSNSDWGYDITVDNNGNAYITGMTGSSNFPTTLGAYDVTFNGFVDIFVLKLNQTGQSLLYSTFIGGTLVDHSFSITIDDYCNAYVTGYTNSSNFPITPGAFNSTNDGSYDVFVLKLNQTGTALIYSTYIGANVEDEDGKGITVDASGNAYVTGWTYSATFPTTTGAFDTTFNGTRDGFVLKLNQTGASLIYSTFIGGSSDLDWGSSIAVDIVGNIYVTGSTDSSDFPTTPDVYDRTFNGGNNDVFVLKLNQTGSSLVYSTFIGGSGDDYGDGLAIDNDDNAYLTGGTDSTTVW